MFITIINFCEAPNSGAFFVFGTWRFAVKQQLIETEYNGIHCHFTEDAWFNATEAASHFGKRPVDWIKNDDTQEYLSILCENHKVSQNHFIKTKKGKGVGGTWIHPKLAVPFSRWLDMRFSIWCDEQIDNLIRGTHAHHDISKLRHEAAASFKLMNAVLNEVRTDEGKKTAAYHYMNEARLVNWSMTGEFKGIDRNSLSIKELEILAKLEIKNAMFISQGVIYKQRKECLCVYAKELMQPKITH